MGNYLIIKNADFSNNSVGHVDIEEKVVIKAEPSPSYAGSVSGSGLYSETQNVVLTCTPKNGYSFDKWKDGNLSNPRTITVGKYNKMYVGLFKPAGEVTNLGSNETLWSQAATPGAGYMFGFKSAISGYVTKIRIKINSAGTGKFRIQIFNEGASTAALSSEYIQPDFNEAEIQEFHLNTPLRVTAGQCINVTYGPTEEIVGENITFYKLSGGDIDTYTGGNKDDAKRIYPYSFEIIADE